MYLRKIFLSTVYILQSLTISIIFHLKMTESQSPDHNMLFFTSGKSKIFFIKIILIWKSLKIYRIFFNFLIDLSKVVILFSGFKVTSIHTFVLVALFVTSLCWFERLSTYYYESSRYNRNQKRFKTVAIRTFGYALLTIMRFFYMLLIMSMNSQIFIVVVTGLTTGQLIVEYIRSIP